MADKRGDKPNIWPLGHPNRNAVARPVNVPTPHGTPAPVPAAPVPAPPVVKPAEDPGSGSPSDEKTPGDQS